MPDLDYVLYDTVTFGAAAPTELLAFQTIPTDEKLSNNRAPGAMQASESFDLQRVGAYADFAVLEANVGTWFNNAVFEIRVKNFTVFKCPLVMILAFETWAGMDASTTAANQAHIGISNPVYTFDTHPIILPPGQPFLVRILQGVAAAATSNIKIILDGVLHLPG